MSQEWWQSFQFMKVQNIYIEESQEYKAIFMSQEWWHSVHIYQKLKNHKKIIAFLCHKNDRTIELQENNCILMSQEWWQNC